MSRKQKSEKMLLRLFRVAEILAKAEIQNPDDIKNVDDSQQATEKAQKLSLNPTKN